MNNWLINALIKEARGRRFRTDDRVRYFTQGPKGKGKGVILTPSFGKGTVVDFDSTSRRYKVRNDSEEEVDVHPRNMISDGIARSTPEPTITETPVEISPIEVEPVSI